MFLVDKKNRKQAPNPTKHSRQNINKFFETNPFTKCTYRSMKCKVAKQNWVI